MLKWLGPRKAQQQEEEVTDDPLAVIGGAKQIYSVSRINPLFNDNLDCTTLPHKPTPSKHPPSGGCSPIPHTQGKPPKRQNSGKSASSSSAVKSGSSGYGSNNDPIYNETTSSSTTTQLRDDSINILEQNAQFVRSILVAANGSSKNCANSTTNSNASSKNSKSRKSIGSGSSGAGTLSTIPEGKVDFSIPRPIWPKYDLDHDLKKQDSAYDSLVDEALLLYTSLHDKSSSGVSGTSGSGCENDMSIRDVLIDLSNTISATVEGKTGLSPEQVLKSINDTILQSLEVLQNVPTDDDVRKLCVNMSNDERMNSVVRAFGSTGSGSRSRSGSSSGHSSESSPTWGSGRLRTISQDAEEIYHSPSGSSSSGFSEATPPPLLPSKLPVFVHEDLNSVRNGVRNAMIYGTLCRGALHAQGQGGKTGACGGILGLGAGASQRLIGGDSGGLGGKQPEVTPVKKSLLEAPEGSKPSVWEMYYGVNVGEGQAINYNPKPTDTPLFPAGRPEADFTLDVPRSELLSRKMKKDKKWRCRCRLLTSFLGLVFFLLSVMAVSLMLTRGKRMFGSMV